MIASDFVQNHDDGLHCRGGDVGQRDVAVKRQEGVDTVRAVGPPRGGGGIRGAAGQEEGDRGGEHVADPFISKRRRTGAGHQARSRDYQESEDALAVLY